MTNGNLNPLSANPTKWPNTLKQFAVKLLTNCLSVFDHFVGLLLKGLRIFKLKRICKLLLYSLLWNFSLQMPFLNWRLKTILMPDVNIDFPSKLLFIFSRYRWFIKDETFTSCSEVTYFKSSDFSKVISTSVNM